MGSIFFMEISGKLRQGRVYIIQVYFFSDLQVISVAVITALFAYPNEYTR